MLNISIAEDCTDAPKKRYVRDFNVDCVTGRIPDALEKLSDEVTWSVIGLKEMTNKNEISASLRTMSRNDIRGFSIDNLVAQGNRVVASGVMQLKDGSSVHFCDIYEFDNHGVHAKIKAITTYGIALHKEAHDQPARA